MVDRMDHFARMRGEAGPEVEPDKDAPPVSVDLVEYLLRIFPLPTPRMATTMDQVLGLSAEMARSDGHQQVIHHLRTLIRGA